MTFHICSSFSNTDSRYYMLCTKNPILVLFSLKCEKDLSDHLIQSIKVIAYNVNLVKDVD